MRRGEPGCSGVQERQLGKHAAVVGRRREVPLAEDAGVGCGDRFANCSLVLGSGGPPAGEARRQYGVPQLLWHEVPVAAAHQVARIDLLAAAGCWAAPGSWQEARRLTAGSAAAAFW